MMPYFSFQWHITDDCDQRCRHCYIFSVEDRTKLDRIGYEDMVAVLDSCLSMCEHLGRTPYFYITGGDPILNRDFWRLLELLRDREVEFGILGNPYHLTDDVCRRLGECGCEKYQLSIDGMRATHDMIRRPGSFDETLEAMPRIRSAGMRCAIMTTVSRANAGELPEIIDTVVDAGADVFAFARYCPGDGDFGGEPLSPSEYRDVLETCWAKFGEHEGCGTAFNLKDHLWTPFLYEKGLFDPNGFPDDGLIYDGCNCGANHITILPNGDVYACRRMDSKVGNVLERPIEEIFLGDAEDAYRDVAALEKCSGCRLLRFCRGCPAVAQTVNGSRLSADPQCWVDTSSDMYRPEGRRWHAP